MAHGFPDWGQTAGVNTVYQLKDLAELAVRLGSIDAFDRRGDVIFLEDFERGDSKFITDKGGLNAATYLSLLHCKSGNFSLNLVAGSTLAVYARYAKSLGVPLLSRIGVELSFASGAFAGYFDIGVSVRDGSKVHSFHIRLDVAAKELKVFDDTGAWVTIATDIALEYSDDLFHTIKVVGDIKTNEYVRVILNSSVYVISGIKMWNAAAIASPYCTLEVTNTGVIASNVSMFIDDIILTQNEP